MAVCSVGWQPRCCRDPQSPDNATLTVEEAARLLGVGRSLAFDAIRRGDFPVPHFRVGRRIVIPTAGVLAALGIDHANDESPALNAEDSLTSPVAEAISGGFDGSG